MLHCVERHNKYPYVKVGNTYTMLDPMPRPLSGHHPFERHQRHGTFDVVGFCATDEKNPYNSRGNAHLALIRWRTTGQITKLALHIIDELPEVFK